MQAIEDRGWPQRGNGLLESSIAANLVALADTTDQDLAATILASPLLHTPSHEAATAVHGILIAAASHPHRVRALILSNPNLPHGLQPHHAGRLAVLPTVLNSGTDAATELFAPQTASPSRRHTQAGGQRVNLEVIRTDELRPNEHALDLMENAIQRLVAFSGQPPPTGFFALVFAPTGLPGNPGTFHHSHIAVDPAYDVPVSHAVAETAANLISHELAHYWWRENEPWLDEGIADALSVIVQRGTDPPKPPCPRYSSIAQLSRIATHPSHPDYACHYSLGSRLFLDLYQRLGPQSFQAGYRHLLASSKTTRAGIDAVNAAFPQAAELIRRHYHGGRPESDTHLTSLPQPTRISIVSVDLPAVKARINRTYISNSLNSHPQQTFSATAHPHAIFLNIEYECDIDGPAVSIPVTVKVIFQDGYVVLQHQADLYCHPDHIGAIHSVSLPPPSPNGWYPGRYDIAFNHDSRAIAALSFTFSP